MVTTKKMVRNVATIAMVLVALVATSGPSHAAFGVAYWGAFTANVGGQTVGIPSGQLTHGINASGEYVNTEYANFVSAAHICDASMRFTYGNGADRFDGNVHWGCSNGGKWRYGLYRYVPRGSACAELWAKNWRVLIARQCHYVHGVGPVQQKWGALGGSGGFLGSPTTPAGRRP